MLFEFLSINPQLIPFFIMFFTGLGLVVFISISYRKRTKRIIITANDLRKYNKLEKIAFFLGGLFILTGILGSIIITEQYGYNTTVTDIHGNKTIEKIGGSNK